MENKSDRMWTFLKLFRRSVNPNISIFNRQFIVNSLWIFKKLKEINESKNPFSLNEELIEYFISIVDEDLLLSDEYKVTFINFLNSSKNNDVRKWDFTQINDALTNIDVFGKDSYVKEAERRIYAVFKSFIVDYYASSTKLYEIQKYIDVYISTRVDIGFSIELMESFIRREETYLKYNRNKDFFSAFFAKFSMRNITKKETYSIFIPLKASKIFKNNFRKESISQNVKFVWYSYPEKMMISPIHSLTSKFDKESLYFAIENVDGIDWINTANKVVWEKASTYISILKTYSFDVDIDRTTPCIVLKNIQKGSKVEVMTFNFNLLEEKSILFGKKNSLEAMKNMKRGVHGDISSKIKSYLRAKTEFETSHNPIERINLASRLMELFLKIPYKRQYGGNTKFKELHKQIKLATTPLLYEHRLNVFLSNYSSLSRIFLFKNINNTNLSNGERSLMIKNNLNMIKNTKLKKINTNNWDRNIISELIGTYKMPKKTRIKFECFLEFICIVNSNTRNKQEHNKSTYNLKNILIAESVEAIFSTLSRKKYLKI